MVRRQFLKTAAGLFVPTLALGQVYLPHRRKAFRSSFSPLNISGCRLWLKADAGCYSDAGSTLCTDGQGVYQWNDQSASSNVFVQATAGKRPVWHSTGLTFTYANASILNTASVSNVSATTWTLFSVYNLASTSFQRMLWDVETGRMTWQACTAAAGNTRLDNGTANVLELAVTGLAQWTATSNNTGNNEAWKNGTSVVTFAAYLDRALSGKMSIGGRYSADSGYMDGDIMEILFYEGILSTANRQSVESYLKTKWGTP